MCPSGLVVFGAGCSLDAVPVRDGLNSTSTGTANTWDTWPTSLRGSRPYVVHVALLEPHALGGVLGQAHLGIRAPICVLSNTWGAASLRQQRFFGPPPLGCCPVGRRGHVLGFLLGMLLSHSVPPGSSARLCTANSGTHHRDPPTRVGETSQDVPSRCVPAQSVPFQVVPSRCVPSQCVPAPMCPLPGCRPRCVPSLPCSPWLRVTARSGSVLWRTEGERPRPNGNGISPNGNLYRPRSPLNEAPNNRHVH